MLPVRGEASNTIRISLSIDGDLQTGLFEPSLEQTYSVSQFFQFAGCKLGEDELVQCILARAKTCEMCPRPIGQGQVDNPPIFSRGLATHKTVFFEKLRLRSNKRRIDLQQLRDSVDRHSHALVDFREDQDDPPLRARDSDSFRPEVTELLEIGADRSDIPAQAPNSILISPSECAHFALRRPGLGICINFATNVDNKVIR